MTHEPTTVTQKLLMQMFGRPSGILGRIGGLILSFEKGEFIPWVVDQLAIAPGAQILEVGFGPGVALQYVAKQTPAGQIVGVDYSDVMVQQATKRNATAIAAGKIEVHYGSASALPIPDETFDGAFSINSMQLWPDAVAGLREIRRVLKAGGKVALGFTAHAGQAAEALPGLATAAALHPIELKQSTLGVCLVAVKP